MNSNTALEFGVNSPVYRLDYIVTSQMICTPTEQFCNVSD